MGCVGSTVGLFFVELWDSIQLSNKRERRHTHTMKGTVTVSLKSTQHHDKKKLPPSKLFPWNNMAATFPHYKFLVGHSTIYTYP
jgi:hypothetical protein